MLEASAASPAVAELLSAVSQQLASHPATHAAATAQPRPAIQVKSVDIVATSASDPRGLVLGVAPLPLTIVGVLMAAAIMLVARFRPAWRQLVALAVVCAVAGLGAYLIVQGFLGALPGEHAATWASLSLTLLAVSAPTAGLIALHRPRRPGRRCRPHDHRRQRVLRGHLRTAVAARRGRPHRAVAPRRAGGNLLRSTAYFNGNGAAGHLIVLIIWSVLGLAAVFAGQRFRVAAGPARNRPEPISPPAGYDPADDNPPVPGPEQAGRRHGA